MWVSVFVRLIILYLVMLYVLSLVLGISLVKDVVNIICLFVFCLSNFGRNVLIVWIEFYRLMLII